jgi:hypothetical protein
VDHLSAFVVIDPQPGVSAFNSADLTLSAWARRAPTLRWFQLLAHASLHPGMRIDPTATLQRQ